MLDAAHHDQAEVASPVSVALQRSLQSWDGLLESLPVGVYTCDRDGALVHHNRRAAELWGRSPPGDARFCGALKLYRPDGEPLPPSQAPMGELLRTGAPIRDQEAVVERPDGTRITVLANLDPLFGPQGEVIGGVCCFHDITERKRAEETVRERERHFAELLEALPAAIYTTDAEGRITFYNQAAADLWGFRPEPNTNRWCGSWRLFWPDGTPMAHEQCPMAVALKENRPIRGAEAIAERPDGTRVPFIPYPTPLRDASGALVGAVNMLVDITPRKRAEETQKLLIDELNHRVKNTLATVQAIARQTLRRAKSPEDFVASLDGRVQALAHAHTLLTDSSWRGADLMALVRDQILLGAAPNGRIACSGPDVTLTPQVALHLAMVLHELGTNARKHGSLSVACGRLAVRWAVESAGSRVLRLRWVETGGPRVSASAAPGFGTALIENSLKAHGGEARMLSEADGVTWEISLPLPGPPGAAGHEQDPTAPASDARGQRPDGREAAEHAELAGRRILVVEDEALLALDIANGLAEAGVAVVGPAGTVERALALAEGAPLDGALLDANLNGRPVDEVAAALTRRNVPFAFVTGYGRASLPKAFRDAAIVTKPFGPRELIEAVRRFAGSRDADILPMRDRTGTG